MYRPQITCFYNETSQRCTSLPFQPLQSPERFAFAKRPLGLRISQCHGQHIFQRIPGIPPHPLKRVHPSTSVVSPGPKLFLPHDDILNFAWFALRTIGQADQTHDPQPSTRNWITRKLVAASERAGFVQRKSSLGRGSENGLGLSIGVVRVPVANLSARPSERNDPIGVLVQKSPPITYPTPLGSGNTRDDGHFLFLRDLGPGHHDITDSRRRCHSCRCRLSHQTFHAVEFPVYIHRVVVTVKI